MNRSRYSGDTPSSGRLPSRSSAVNGVPLGRSRFATRWRNAVRRSARSAGLGLSPRGYALATLHRPENVDDPRRLAGILKGLGEVARRLPLVFPVHPRTRARLRGLRIPEGVRLRPPLGYLEFLGLMDLSAVVLTDSGGIQLETSALGVPCLTLRDTTERPLTCSRGTNRLVGTSPAALLRGVGRVLAHPPKARPHPLWDGRAAPRIAREIASWLKARRP